ncbi:hypothetical protein IID21_04990 [Patescibacteria group bacterium]|nr:hypothetical protein [Patescibacteria group bacterium]
MGERKKPWYRRERKISLNIPEELLDHLREVATAHQTTDIDVVQRIMKTGLTIIDVVDNKDGEFILRMSDGSETEVKIFDD